MQTNVRHRAAGPRGLAILRYSFAKKGNTTMPSRPVPETSPGRDDIQWSLAHARRFRSRRRTFVPPASRRFTYLGTQNRLDDGSLVWALNNITFKAPETPVLHSMAMGLDSQTNTFVEQTTIPTPFDYNLTLSQANFSIIAKSESQIVKIAKDEVVEFVFQNTRSLGGPAEIHPWHLHLHNFWVLGYGGPDSTWTEKDTASYNTNRAVSRNTMMLYPQGWTAIRFKADNPGAAHFRTLFVFTVDVFAPLLHAIPSSHTANPLSRLFCVISYH